MTLAFDPKWGQVVALSFLEGVDGQTKIHGEKSANVYDALNCSISRACPAFPAGALRLMDNSAARYALAPGGQSVFGNFLVEVSFYQTEWSAMASEMVILYMHWAWQISLSPVDKSLRFWINAGTHSSPVWVSVSYQIPDPTDWLGRRNDVRCRFSTTSMSIEVNGLIVASIDHGVTTIYQVQAELRVGGISAPAQNFIGWIGPFRWTNSDLRPELIGLPMDRFPVLGAVDPHREKVVFHSHFEPTDTGVPVDTKGNTITMQGAVITTAERSYGLGCLDIKNGGILIGPNPAFALGDRDFAIEFSVPGSYAGYEWVPFSMLADDGSPAFRLRGSSNFNLLVTINGVESTILPTRNLSTGRYAVCRTGGQLSVFRNGTRIVALDVSGVGIASGVYFRIGATPPASSSTPRVDEFRLTVGHSRFDAGLASVSQPAEPFPEYGPRSLSGIIDDTDGNPVVCKVRAYHSATGRLVSEGMTDIDGSFVLPVADIDEHFWTAHMPGRQALIGDHVLPVVIT